MSPFFRSWVRRGRDTFRRSATSQVVRSPSASATETACPSARVCQIQEDKADDRTRASQQLEDLGRDKPVCFFEFYVVTLQFHQRSGFDICLDLRKMSIWLCRGIPFFCYLIARNGACNLTSRFARTCIRKDNLYTAVQSTLLNRIGFTDTVHIVAIPNHGFVVFPLV